MASEFDEQTLSAVAWLNSNSDNMSCYKLIPFKIHDEVYINVEKLLPLADYEDYYVNFLEKSSTSIKKTGKKLSRQRLPKIDSLLEWGVVQAGDLFIAKDSEDEATLLSNGNVEVNGVEQSMQNGLRIYTVGPVFKPMFLRYINKLRSLYLKSEKSIWIK
ncbi:hypothetical protein [Neobacillus drentensis]|uniref:hypothetical protein n=1 Tax=Neobacillus drentensis TaxID=220684 RepID=UPI003000B008